MLLLRFGNVASYLAPCSFSVRMLVRVHYMCTHDVGPCLERCLQLGTMPAASPYTKISAMF